jgi:hypothetical protein
VSCVKDVDNLCLIPESRVPTQERPHGNLANYLHPPCCTTIASASRPKNHYNGSGSMKTSEKKQLLKVRTLRRAERAEAKRINAENHKGAVSYVLMFHPSPQTQELWLSLPVQAETHEHVPGKYLPP